MKIYFTATHFNANKNSKEIISILKKENCEVYTNYFSRDSLYSHKISSHKLEEGHKEWLVYIRDCDCVVVEGSYPSSIHVGFEIGYCLSRAKPIILLYEKDKDPFFLNNSSSPRLIKSEYTSETLQETLNWCLEEVKKMINRRFTFFVPPEIDLYLEKVARKTGVSRSEFIRNLIEKEIKNH